jgi:hypothetical protein
MIILKILKKLYSRYFGQNKEKLLCIQDPDKASKILYDALVSDEPCMIARFGSTELTCLSNYIGVCSQKKQYFSYIKGESNPWWWQQNIMSQMQQCAGFFPPTQDKIEQFCELMLEDMKELDILGSWLPQERDFEKQISKTKKVHLRLLEPFWSKNPWTKALEGKKVLVVHPFDKTIRSQYVRRELLFNNDNIFPKFKSFHTIRAVQSLGQGDSRFKDWFEALDYMKAEIDKLDYDICFIGAGAYGFPLAAHVKRRGKKTIHLGGALQLLFGIIGSRWQDPNYGVKEWGIPKGSYTNLINEYWVRPDEDEKPKNADNVEDGCYW